MSEWKEQGGNQQIWKPAPGDVVTGEYKGTTKLNPQYPDLYIVGETLVPGKADIVKKFRDVKVGDEVRVTFVKKMDIPGGKTKNVFKVESKTSDDKKEAF